MARIIALWFKLDEWSTKVETGWLYPHLRNR